MICRRKIILAALFLYAAFSSTYAQDLEYLPQVVARTPNKDTAVSLIFTADNQERIHSKQNRPYIQSVQIVDADQPWPPRWFSGTAVYSDGALAKDTALGYARFDFIEDARVVAGRFSFFKMLGRPPMEQSAMDSPELDAYMLLNEKMECVDTVSSLTAFRNLYYHDISIDSNGNKLVSLRKDTYLDLRDYSNNQADYSRHCEIDIIEELDSKDSVLLQWNPVYHIDPTLFRFKEVLASRAFASNTDAIQWTRLTSAQWDYDGNILYSMKHIGIGKVSLADGHIMWQINYNQIPMISGKDTVQWYAQHDFNYLYQTDSTSVYSLYSTGRRVGGQDTGAIEFPSCGVLFEQNKKTLKVKVLHYQHPKDRFVAAGQGGYDPGKNGDYTLSYGFLREPINETGDFSDFMEYGGKDGKYTIYQLPRGITCYKSHKLENFKRPPRPVITRKNDQLQATGEDMQEFTWYRLSGPNNTLIDKVGTGPSFRYGDGGVFCVAAKYGIGYAVSKPFVVFGNSPY